MLCTHKNFLLLFLFIFNNLSANEFIDDQDLRDPYNFIDSNAQKMVFVLRKNS